MVEQVSSQPSPDSPASARATPAEATGDKHEPLWKEYELVQGKLDKIGDFHFKVRGWVITLTSALVVAGAKYEVPWPVFFAALLPLLTFQLIDSAQANWRGALSQRADQIERRLRQSGESPRIAQVLRQRHRDLQSRFWGRLILRQERAFYFVAYLLLVGTGVIVAIHQLQQTPGAGPAPAAAAALAPKPPPQPTMEDSGPPALQKATLPLDEDASICGPGRSEPDGSGDSKEGRP